MVDYTSNSVGLTITLLIRRSFILPLSAPGQAIGASAAFLPPAIQAKFTKLFDDAPRIPFSEVQRVFQAEFGRPLSGPDGVFAEFEEIPCASASVAQVHKARIHGEDTWVAVKVQKPAVSKQMEPDLAAFRAVMWIYENWLFDMPVYFVVGAFFI